MTQLPVETGNVVHFDPSRRYFERFEQGIEARHDGRPLAIVNWSLGGLGVVLPAVHWNGEAVFDLVLLVPVGDHRFPLPVQVRLVHYNPISGYAGLKFEAMTASQFGVLRYVQEQKKANLPVTLTGLHDACRWHENTLAIVDDPLPVQKRRYWLRYAAVAGLLLVTLLLLGRLVRVYAFSLPAVYAAVSAPAWYLTAPADGVLQPLAGLAAEQVATGMPLVRLDDPVMQAERDALDAELALLQDRIGVLRQQERDMSGLYGDYRDLADAIAAQRQADHLAAQAVARERAAHLARMAELSQQGFSSKADLDAARRDHEAARAAVAQARAGLREAGTNQRLAAKQVLFTGARVDGGNLQELRRDIALAEASFQNAHLRLGQLVQRHEGLTALSPCDCRVVRVRATPGSWVRAGTPVIDLRSDRPEDVLVEARIPQEQVERLSLEGGASVRLPGKDRVLAGRIVEIQRLPLAGQREGLPVSLGADEGLATVLVRTTEPLEDEDTGLPVQVVFDLRPGGIVGVVLGIF